MFIVHSYSGSIGDFESFGGGPTPSWTTKDVKVQFLRSRVNCANKLNHFLSTDNSRLVSGRGSYKVLCVGSSPTPWTKDALSNTTFIKVNRWSHDFGGSTPSLSITWRGMQVVKACGR